MRCKTASHLAEDQAGVRPAKPERVRQHRADAARLGLKGHKVNIAPVGRIIQIQRRRGDLIPHRQQRLYLHLWNTDTLTEWLGRILPWEGPWRLNVSCIAYAPAYENRALCGEN